MTGYRHSGPRISPWSRLGMSSEASIIADRLGLHIMASSPAGPYALWKPETLARREGPNIDALVLAAAKELERAD